MYAVLRFLFHPNYPPNSPPSHAKPTGPNVFLHSIQEMNRLGPPVRFYMTSSNGDYSVIKVVNKCKQFGPFEWLHLDGTFRGKNTKGGLNQSLLALREQCRDDLPASSSRS